MAAIKRAGLPPLTLTPLGKWLWVVYDADAPLVEAIGLDVRRNTARVLAAGPAATVAPESRILFEPGSVREHAVDGVKILLVHEDHVVGCVREGSST